MAISIVWIVAALIGWLLRNYFKIKYKALYEAKVYSPMLDEDYEQMLEDALKNTDFWFNGVFIMYVVILLALGIATAMYLGYVPTAGFLS